MSRTVVGTGLFLFAIAACGHDVGASGIGSTTQPLMAAPEEIKGEDLGEKELVLTFDDGPGSLDTTGEIADYLAKHDPPIIATFFVNGACIKATDLPTAGCDAPKPDAKQTLDKIRASGHWIANHATTHRDLQSVPTGDVLKELTQTDDAIKDYLVYNLQFFRAPLGSWSQEAYDEVKDSPMKKYIGPIYWTAGGNSDKVADWACWNGPNGDGTGVKKSTRQCGDEYFADIESYPKKNGIILFHDPYGDPGNGLDTAPGSTLTMIKYLVPKLDAAGYKYKTLADVPAIKALMPKCDASCGLECKGPGPEDCLTCADGKPATDGTCAGGGQSSTSSSGSNGGNASSSSGDGSNGGIRQTPTEAAPEDEGCNTSGRSGGGATAVLLALAAAISLRSKRRRV